jgi:hypothetical protein
MWALLKHIGFIKPGGNTDQSSQGSGESRFEQGVDEFNEDYTPSVIGATSIDDYVFGGMRDD